MSRIASILVENAQASLIKSIPTSKIKKRYKRFLNVDVNRFFKNTKHISLYECEVSKYRFFHPFDIAGDGKFYEDLSKNDWYYMPWKWEHEETKKLLSPEHKVLEVGCAHGAFLKSIQPVLNHPAVGLELNKQAVNSGKENNIDIRLETIEEHAANHQESYDVVCSYQVLEHITAVKPFIQANIECLKKGGLLVISVPNNDSFIKDDDFPLLNMPPHHMGRWNAHSLSFLTNIFPVKLKEIKLEPFQEHHVDYYLRMKLNKRIKSSFITAVLFKLKLNKLLFNYSKVREEVSKIDGHSIMVVFEKQ